VRDVCISPTVEVTDYAIERSTAQQRSGSYSLRYYLKPTPISKWPSSGEATHRAELGPKYNSPVSHYPAEGEEVWYGFSYYFPSDFVFAPQNIENDVRFSIAQWQHGSPGSSIIALEVIGDKIMMQRQTGYSTSSNWLTPDTITAITLGQWMDVILRVKWSKQGGILQCWINGQLKLDLNNVQTIYTDLSNGGGLKPGIYYWRWKDQQSVQNSLNAGINYREIFMDEIRQYKGANGYSSVAPSG
ncbi:MAG: polysaccharide lyase, partial [Saprospiraceae bacterium]|nr:polysaccharide lyase [Saprospiraceae bacterium]